MQVTDLRRPPAGALAEVAGRPGAHPLQGRFAAWGVLAAVAAGVAVGSVAVGVAAAVLFAVAGIVWRRDQPPALAFCLGYQWSFIVTGYVYLQLAGVYPGQPVVGDLDAALWYSLIGLGALALGVRAAEAALDARGGMRTGPAPVYDVRRLCVWVLGLYAVNWFVQVFPMALVFNAAQPIQNLLSFRTVILCVLFIEVARQRSGYRYAVIGLLYVMLPVLTSTMSEFKELLFLVLIVLMGQWRPWSRVPADRRANRRIVAGAAAIGVGLVLAGVVWEGRVKPLWRASALGSASAAGPVTKLGLFLSTVAGAASDVDTRQAAALLAARMSSGAAYFSLVVQRVPRIIPHEDGALSWRAVEHVVKPRVFFPDKPSLGSDSWLVSRYAGLPVAGEEEGTSIGLGYMAELYIDFGVPGMVAALFAYGALLGLIAGAMRRAAPSPQLFGAAAAVMFLQHLSTYDGEIAKQLGGLLQTALVFGTLLWLIGPALSRQWAGERRQGAPPVARSPRRGGRSRHP